MDADNEHCGSMSNNENNNDQDDVPSLDKLSSKNKKFSPCDNNDKIDSDKSSTNNEPKSTIHRRFQMRNRI